MIDLLTRHQHILDLLEDRHMEVQVEEAVLVVVDVDNINKKINYE